MGLKQTVAPGVEPLSVADAKRQASTDTDALDTDVALWIQAARFDAEMETGRQLIDATWVWKLDWFPVADVFEVPRPPLSSVTSIQYIDIAGDTQTLSTDVYELDTFSEPGRIALKPNQSWPDTEARINAVTITFVAGYGDEATDVPPNFIEAIRMQVAHFSEHRESVSEVQQLREMPFGVKRLLFPSKIIKVGF